MAAVEDPRGHYFKKTLWTNMKEMCSVKKWKQWMGFTAGMDEMDELSKFPYYFVLANFVLHLFFMAAVFAPIGSSEQGLLWDKSGLLLWNFVFMITSWYFFWMTVKTKPGYVDDGMRDIQKWRDLYEETLESYADESCDPNSSPFVSLRYRSPSVFARKRLCLNSSPTTSFTVLLPFLHFAIHTSNSAIRATLPGPFGPSIVDSRGNVSWCSITFARSLITPSVSTTTSISTYFWQL
jgi:hypothetical protein